MTTPPADEGNRSFIILISCVATIGGFLFGFDSGVINGTVDGLQDRPSTPTRSAPASTWPPCCWAARWARSSPGAWPTGTAAARC